MKRPRLPAVLLAVAMLLGLLTGCGGTGNSAAASAAEETSASAAQAAPEEAEAPAETGEAEEAAFPAQEPGSETESSGDELAEDSGETLELEPVDLPIFDEPVDLSFWAPLPFFMEGYVSDMGQDLYLLSQLQKDCNFNLHVTSVNGMAENEQFNLLIASGDYQDILCGMANYPAGYDAAISNDIIIDLMDLVMEYAPNYWYYVNSTDSIRANIISDDGALPTIATIYKEIGCENRGMLFRSDWLRELGMSKPETYEELHDYLLRCNETYGSKGLALTGSAMGSTAGVVNQLSYGMDFAIGNYNVIDGQVVYSYLNDNLYDYLDLMSTWYADGSIVSEFYNLSTDEGDRGVPNGIYAMTISSAANLKTMDNYADAGAVYEIDAMPAPTDGSGKDLHYRWTDDFSPLKRRDSWAISTACDHPEDVLKIVNYLFSEEGQLFFNYGTEGYTFEFDENGNPRYTDVILNNPDYPEMFATYLFVSNVATEYLPSIMDATVSYYYFGDHEWEIFETFRDCEADGSYNMPTAVTLNEQESEEYATVASDVNTYVTTELLRFITEPGALSREACDQFQQTVRDMGGETMEELYQSAYERYLNKLR